MKILFLSSRLPYPPVGGDKLKNYYLLQILAKHFDVHLVTVTDEPFDDRAEQFLAAHTSSYRVFAKPKYRFRLNTAKALFNDFPLQVNYYYFRDVQQYVDEVARDVDLVFCTLIRTAKYAERMDKPKILDLADSISLNYVNSYRREKSLFWKTLYKFESSRLLACEKNAIDTFDKTLLFNPQETQFFNRPDKIVWIPHGVNENLFLLEDTVPDSRNCVVFFGKMDYPPNVNAVLWFCENVLPKLDRRLRFVVAGARPSRAVLKLPSKYINIEVTGFIDNPYRIIKSALCVVAPMQTGGGIQNKILEAMATGAVVVATTLAATPIIGVCNNDTLVVRDDPTDMAAAINDIFENRDKYVPIGQNARQYIKNNFTWTIYEKKILAVIHAVLGYRLPPPVPTLVTRVTASSPSD